MTERDEHVALLVNEVGFTPEQADNATSGDIDRNGAAAMLPGIIEALEERIGAAAHADDDLVEMGVRHIESMAERGGAFAGPHDGGFGSRPQMGLTALKLLARAREAEAKLALAEAEARGLRLHIERMNPGPESEDQAAVGALIREGVPRIGAPDPRAIAEAIVDHVDLYGWDGPSNGNSKPFAERLLEVESRTADDGSMAARHDKAVAAAMRAGHERMVHTLATVIEPLVMGQAEALVNIGAYAPIDPTVAALAVVDHLVESGSLRVDPAALAEQLSKVIASVARDTKPEVFPLWCVAVSPVPPGEEQSFWGPYEFAAAEERATALRLEYTEAELPHLVDRVAVRRCRRARVSEVIGKQVPWGLDVLAEHIEENATDVPARFWLNMEKPWVRARAKPDMQGLDALLEVDAYEVEPDGPDRKIDIANQSIAVTAADDIDIDALDPGQQLTITAAELGKALREQRRRGMVEMQAAVAERDIAMLRGSNG